MTETIFIFLGIMMVLVFLGVHVAVALGVASALGVYWMLGSVDIAFSILQGTAYESLRKDIFIVIPLFVLMGEFISRSGAAKDIFTICNRAFLRVPGCLAVATVSGNSIFAAITGVCRLRLQQPLRAWPIPRWSLLVTTVLTRLALWQEARVWAC